VPSQTSFSELKKISVALEEGNNIQKDIVRQMRRRNEMEEQKAVELKMQNALRHEAVEEMKPGTC
jgi:hypothetical protein